MSLNLQPLTCRVSDAVYKKYQEIYYGLRTCPDRLDDEEIEDILENIALLKYVCQTNLKGCDEQLLIETLT